jgi:hypothetical protein
MSRFGVSVAVTALLFAFGVSGSADAAHGDHSLRFHGTGVGDIDRVKIRIDEPGPAGGPPADIGATDFTIEFWVKGTTAENRSTNLGCGSSNYWISGNIILDRDRYNQDRAYGVSFADGRLMFGVDGEYDYYTLCSDIVVLNGAWRHVALQRRATDGHMWIIVDGKFDAFADGPDGDISYPDDGIPGDYCGGPCDNSDPFLVIAAEKHDAGSAYPSFAGWFDELRLSTTLRYTSDFSPASAPFSPDADTAALYHFDEGAGSVATDSSGAVGGPSNGEIKTGGSPLGPEWSTDTPLTDQTGPFTDIAGTTFETEILWLHEQGITTGCDSSRYCPSDPVTRGQMATFLTRALELEPGSGDIFTDDNGSTHETSIEALAAAGVTSGCDVGLFCPNDPITRAQMATFLARGIDTLLDATDDYFDDDNGNLHEANIDVMAENAITLGCAPRSYCPGDPVTRGQMAAFVYRALNGTG